MLIIDRFAYTNKFSNLNPCLKVIISLLLILLSIVNSNIYVLCFMIAGNILTTIFGAGIPKKSYIKMIAAPAVYLIISIFAIIFTFGFSDIVHSENFVYLKQFRFLKFYIGLAEGSVKNGLTLGLKSLSGIASMYFLILTTPCSQQIKVMKKAKLPVVFIELYVLTYRFIAIFFEEAILIHTAQKMRFGYSNYKNSMNSLAVLIKVLFVRIMKRYKDMQSILEIKHFDGNFYTD
ncbi:cobalt ECF transporter T component CbiQ [Sedimentibacter sp. MB31-C6]|uniref:cobalt ECF transporter T component CbiQ n=1 Tax=Sedimentibacter sp. MB31-C6 TaxID=3109366 RepID=UPI002DDCC1BA|nr:cobalt ECF transporter T component CbiQ [Sedimentibacter sp. MB36-C1]WSI02843.1 cobalt ECF transporter T component CbiQ [Sedimentibacter sp. MB36-C1]